MKEWMVKYIKISSLLVVAFLFSTSLIYAGDKQNPPGSNQVIEQICIIPKNVVPASKALEAKLIEIARDKLDQFLEGINKDGYREKFGFSDPYEIDMADVGTIAYQVYTRCKNNDIPTNVWYISVIVESQVIALITVDLTEEGWQAVNYGATKFVRKLSTADRNVLNQYSLQNDKGLHRIIIQDHINNSDFLLIQKYNSMYTESYKAENAVNIESYSIDNVKGSENNISIGGGLQEQTQWCWAGVSEEIFGTYNKPVPRQCEIAEYARKHSDKIDFGSYNCCVTPGANKTGCNQPNYLYYYGGSIQDILASMQSTISIKSYSYTRALTKSEIRNDLVVKGFVYVIQWIWDNGGGHFLEGYGISTDDKYLFYMNPAKGYYYAFYEWVVKGGGHSWDYSLRISNITIKEQSTFDIIDYYNSAILPAITGK